MAPLRVRKRLRHPNCNSKGSCSRSGCLVRVPNPGNFWDPKPQVIILILGHRPAQNHCNSSTRKTRGLCRRKKQRDMERANHVHCSAFRWESGPRSSAISIPIIFSENESSRTLHNFLDESCFLLSPATLFQCCVLFPVPPWGASYCLEPWLTDCRLN